MQSDDGGIPGMGVSPGNPPPGSPPFGPLRAASAGEVEALLSAIDTGDSAARLRALLATRPLLAEDAAPVVERMFAVDELSPLARGFACLFLGYKPTSRSHDLLTGVVENPREMPEVVGNAVAALGYARDPTAMPLCLRLLRADATHWSVRVASAVALGVLAEANPDARALVFDDLAQAFEKAEREDPLKQALVGALGDARDGRAVPLIAEYVAEAEAGEDFFMAQCACEALGKLPCAESERVLQAVVDDGTRHVNVHWAAEIALGAVQEALRG